MDFLDPNKKRSNLAKLYIGYVLMAIAIAMGALILLFAIFGYGFNSGQVIQNGLVFISSQPDAADVYIEGLTKDFKDNDQTNTKFTLNEGSYKATLVKDGYRSWQREFNLPGGSVVRMLYPFLFPEELKPENKASYDIQPGLVTQSPDRQWIVIEQPTKFEQFDIYNANDTEAEKTTATIPAAVLTDTDEQQTLEVIEWSNDNQNILMKYRYGDKQEFIIFNWEEPGKSFNVNKVSNQDPYDVQMKDKKIEDLYIQTAPAGLLETINVESKNLTPLVGRALAYKSHGDDMLVYVEPHKTDDSKVEVRIQTNNQDFLLRTLSADSEYSVDVARYDNNWYVAVASSKDNRAYIYKNPVEVLQNRNAQRTLFARTMRIDNPTNLSFSANTQFIVAQAGKSFAVYNAELDVQYRYTLEEEIDTSQPAEWMDGHRLVTTVDGNVLVFDYDGINKQTLMPIISNTPLMFDRDYETAYSLTKQNNSFILQLTPMRVESN